MSDNTQPDQLWLMLGEIRGDLKYLVNERRLTSERMDAMEATHVELTSQHEHRITRLEHFKTRIGVITAALGVLVPTVLTAAAHKIGLL